MQQDERSGLGQVALGAIVFAVGLGLTVLGASSTSSGRYIFFWGAMLAGVIWVFKGLSNLSDAEGRLIARWGLPLLGLVVVAVVASAIPGFKAQVDYAADKKPLLNRGVRDGFGDGVALDGKQYRSMEKVSLQTCADTCVVDQPCAGYTFRIAGESCALFSHVRAQKRSAGSFSDIVAR